MLVYIRSVVYASIIRHHDDTMMKFLWLLPSGTPGHGGCLWLLVRMMSTLDGPCAFSPLSFHHRNTRKMHNLLLVMHIFPLSFHSPVSSRNIPPML